LRTPLTARLVVTAREVPTWLMLRAGADPDRRRAFAALGVHLLEVGGTPAGVDLHAGLRALGDAGISRLLVEGGAQIAAALLRDMLVDRIAWFHAPGIVGGDGWPAVQTFGIDRLDAMPRFVHQRATLLGNDMLTEFIRQA
jgi:diaminohydroxyphosphoribosylaminopyrimidine deaminase / 5-amino-6-(5-phosphoribosylamino)uracil reductase